MTKPISISPSPIIEAVCEIRFKSSTTKSAAIFAKLYSALAAEMSETEQLPILQMPAEVIEQQPELKYAPHYRLKNDKFLVNIGSNLISVNRLCVSTAYASWLEYKEVIDKVLAAFKTFVAPEVEEIERTSVRYINFFDKKIEEVLNVNIDFLGSEVGKIKNTTLSFIKPMNESIELAILVASNAKAQLPEGLKEGLVLNLEASSTTLSDLESAYAAFEKLHAVVEDQFFEALLPEYLNTLDPKYA